MSSGRNTLPFKWPFPPRPKNQGSRARSVGKTTSGISRKAMLADVVLVIVWGASIPGLMWLGAAGGF